MIYSHRGYVLPDIALYPLLCSLLLLVLYCMFSATFNPHILTAELCHAPCISPGHFTLSVGDCNLYQNVAA